MRAGDAWFEKLAMFISQRCVLHHWSAVFCRHYIFTDHLR